MGNVVVSLSAAESVYLAQASALPTTWQRLVSNLCCSPSSFLHPCSLGVIGMHARHLIGCNVTGGRVFVYIKYWYEAMLLHFQSSHLYNVCFGSLRQECRGAGGTLCRGWADRQITRCACTTIRNLMCLPGLQNSCAVTTMRCPLMGMFATISDSWQ